MRTFSLSLVVLLTANLAYAQGVSFDGRGRAPSAYGVPQGQFGFGAPTAGFIHHSATAQEAAARGAAAMIQARGQYNLLTSLAALNATEAQRRELENKQLKADRYLAMRQSYRERRAAELSQSRADINAPKETVAADAISAIPREIFWPVALQASEFDGYRRLVEQIVTNQNSGRAIAFSDKSRLHRATRLVESKLTSDGSAEAEAAMAFLETLTGKTPRQATHLANNR